MFFCLDYLLLSIFYQNFKAAGQVLGVQCFHCEVYLDPASNPMKGDLCASGFVIKMNQRVFEPCSKNLTGLVLLWTVGTAPFRLNKAERVDKACSIIDYIQSKLFVSARLLSFFLGSWSVMSMSPVVGRLAPIITRHCLTSIAASPDWDTKFEMDHFLPRRGQILVGKYHYSRH